MKNKVIAAVIGIVVSVWAAQWVFNRPAPPKQNLDAFAQCLTEKGAVMYGADWCPNCQKEKKAFGDSFKFINYVECPDNPKQCVDTGITGYPTWIFPGGSRYEGEQGINKLSQISGCNVIIN